MGKCEYGFWPVSRCLETGVAGLHDAGLVGEHDRLHAVTDTELGEQMCDTISPCPPERGAEATASPSSWTSISNARRA